MEGGGGSVETNFKRMMELREDYEKLRREIGVPLTGREIRVSRFSPDPSESDGYVDDAAQGKQDDMDDEDSEGRRKRLRLRSHGQGGAAPSPTSVQGLQATIKGIIERHGGSCHLETIVEHVKMRWQRDRVYKMDGSPFGHADCKKLVQSNFRTRSNNRFVFVRDKENEGCWCVNLPTEGEDKAKVITSLEMLIIQAIEEHGGTCILEDICSFVTKHWVLHTLSDGSAFTPVELEQNVRISLSTNPKLQEDFENLDYYQVAQKKKRKLITKREDGVDPRLRVDPARRRTRADIEETKPNHGQVCKCALSTWRDFNAKWKKCANGEPVCVTCSLPCSKQACPVCGKMYKRGDTVEEDNTWIRCDDCHRWVMTKCDNIKDLSIYDDSNPNHLHYSCPICRSAGSEDSDERHSKVNSGQADEKMRNPRKASRRKIETIELDHRNHYFDLLESENRIEMVESELLDKLEYEEDLGEVEDEELRERLRSQQDSLAYDVAQYATQLKGKRERELFKSQAEFQRQLKRLKEERERRDEGTEMELIQELKEYFWQQKKDYDKFKAHALKDD